MTHKTSVTKPASVAATTAASISLSNAFWFHFGMRIRQSEAGMIVPNAVICEEQYSLASVLRAHCNDREEIPVKKILIAAAVAGFTATSAFAQSGANPSAPQPGSTGAGVNQPGTTSTGTAVDRPDTMRKDGMSGTSGMSTTKMKKDGMAKDGMAKDHMKK